MSRPVVVTARAKRDLERLDRAVADRVIRALERLADTGVGDVRKLSGTAEGMASSGWRLAGAVYL